MEIYVIRHGQSVGNTKKGFIAGRKDPSGLTIKGKSQIIRAAWDLSRQKFDQIYSSPVIRAKESAAILSNLLQTPVKTLPFLAELDQGIFENHFWWEVVPLSFKYSAINDPRSNFEARYKGGESFKMLAMRVQKGLSKLSKMSDNQKLLLVTHDAVISAMSYIIEHQMDFSKDNIDSKHFMEYLHESRIGNGSYIKITVKNGFLNLAEEQELGLPISSDPKSVCFYTSGLFKFTEPAVCKSFETASKHQVYLVEDHKSYLLKLLGNQETTETLHLLEIYKYLNEKTTIPTPVIKYYDDEQVFFDKNVLISDYTEGENMEKCLKNHPGKLSPVLIELYKAVQQIQSIPIQDVKNFWYTSDIRETSRNNWELFIKKAVENSLETLENLKLDKDTKINTSDTLLSLKKYLSSNKYQIVPLHGDLSSENIVISHYGQKCTLTKILDFERTRIGDPLWDLAYFYGWVERINKQVAEEWKQIFWPRMSTEDQKIFSDFRILFHLWTVRDMQDYKGHSIREQRGLKSLEILSKGTYSSTAV